MQMIEKGRLRPGMVLGQDIYNFGHQIVIKRGTVLNDHMINKLQQFSILRVMVEDELIGTYEKKKYHRSAYSERVQNSPEFQRFQRDYDKELIEFENIINNIVERNCDIDGDELFNLVLELLEDTQNTFNAFDMVQNLRHYDDSTYAHSINVGMLSYVFASWLGFSEEEKKTVTLAGILHDIGKTKMPLQIIQKPGKLSNEEYRIIKKHTEMGYQILEEKQMDYHIRNAALMHHERCDGSGYPNGLKEREIDRFAKVISIVDVYDAMTSPRVYRGPMCPFDVIDVFVKEGLQKYDSRYILVFLKRIAESYMGERVCLSDGRKGTIIYIDGQAMARPTIMVDGTPVDLRKEKSLMIHEIL